MHRAPKEVFVKEQKQLNMSRKFSEKFVQLFTYTSMTFGPISVISSLGFQLGFKLIYILFVVSVPAHAKKKNASVV